ncbi:diguanylate cyclase/phosphodiesterase with PAS/PAC sensor(s) [Sideroxydans lithotrophicus ES-1]|uniref:Diguanylate cyclase/phosphodiesterase with PAS/PAC sensor(S) n=1 Tax=Sideroxydans lithotrophicus (strain ES-1) TaxID=580332 RepID=D5CRP6_SIDLE|nr:diguanylate cyclase/phosphodiesterase with PAS/PAC sensor(s) [Sideroxydans lithotrophicus ES-1]
MLLFGWRLFPAIIIGEFFANLGTELTPLGAFGLACGNALEALLGYYLLRHRVSFNERLSTIRDVGLLFVFGALASPLVAALNGAWWIKLSTGESWQDYIHTVQYWWMGDALGIALFTTTILAWTRGDSIVWSYERVRRGVLAAVVLLLTCWILFLDLPGRLLEFGLFFPLLIWIALNFDLRCVSGALLLIFLSSILGLLSLGDLRGSSLDTLVNFVWLYNLLFGLTALSVAVLNAQHRRSEHALKLSEDNLNRAQSIVGIGSWHLDIVNNCLQWSDETYHIFGVAEGTPLNYEVFLEHVHADDRDLVNRTWQQALLRQPYDIEHRILVNGEIRWVREKANLDFDAHGNAVYAIGTVRDITRYKQEEATLRLAARVFDSSGEAILITDENVRVVAVNHSFVAMSGYRSEEVMGKNPRMLSSGRHDAEFYRAMWDDINQHGYWQGEIWDKHKSGRIYPKWMSITAVRDEHGKVVNYISIARDTTEQTEAEKNIHFLAYYDVLTGLPNRTLLRDRLGQMIAVAHRDKHQFSLIFLDLDRFKYINDSMGHSVGDRLLQSVALRIQDCVREGDTVARLGGDEFIVLLREAGESAASVVAQKLLIALATPYDLDGQVISTQASIGISIYPDQAQDADTLIKNADMAMYRAKEEGRNNFQFFVPEMNFRVDLLFSMEKDLRLALERGELFLQYQPQADLASGTLSGVEALIRWDHPVKGQVSPAEFIPVAEETGQIVAIGEWVLRTACSQMAEWRKTGMHDLTIAVNLSIRQLRQPDLAELIKSVLLETGLDARHLELEITEGIMMGDNQAAFRFLSEMQDLGVQLSIDDFGTGFSSLNYLKQMPVNKLKIDQSFIRDIETDEGDAAIIRSIISLGHRLNLRVIAEGVETQEQLDFLRIRGCDEIQGYFYSRPLLAEDFMRFVKAPPRLN